ncbi:hypothetical protein L2E82_31876 [Cichorium intybus]|uniref:Uncharacterized protein n=1 Tax=Cichorium intybus TaxID=13427 RepID=A0ACB9BFZ9_CICIN|nr:hypothetical protein L2E82_31876 [Cichorium intybus]
MQLTWRLLLGLVIHLCFFLVVRCNPSLPKEYLSYFTFVYSFCISFISSSLHLFKGMAGLFLILVLAEALKVKASGYQATHHSKPKIIKEMSP